MFASWLDHPVVYSFTRSRLAQSAGLIALVMVLGAVFAPWLAPSNPFDLASLDLNDALLPPAWQEQGSWKYWLGTDDQGTANVAKSETVSLIATFAASFIWSACVFSSAFVVSPVS